MTAIGVLLQIFRSKSKDARAIEKGIEYANEKNKGQGDQCKPNSNDCDLRIATRQGN